MSVVFFFNDPATTEIYTLSLHDALPICQRPHGLGVGVAPAAVLQRADGVAAEAGALGQLLLRQADRLPQPPQLLPERGDRKSTRLNSSHANISYAVFCLKKKKPPPQLVH